MRVVAPGLAAISYVGGSLAAAYQEWATNRRFVWVEGMMAILREALEAKTEWLRAGRHLLETDWEVLDLALERVQVHRRADKRERFARLVASCWTDLNNLGYEKHVRFVRALDEFDELHIRVLRTIAQNIFVSYNDLPALVGLADVTDEERDGLLIPVLDRLATGYGFVSRGWGLSGGGSHLVGSGKLSQEGIARKCEHIASELGLAFLRAVSEPGSDRGTDVHQDGAAKE
jgi:hypothetical protein